MIKIGIVFMNNIAQLFLFKKLLSYLSLNVELRYNQ